MEGMVQQFFARDYRKIARDKLRGHWGTAVLVGLVAIIFMGTGYYTAEQELPPGSMSEVLEFIQRFSFPAVISPAFYLSGGLLAAVSLALFLLQGAVEQGWCLFNIRLCRMNRRHFPICLAACKTC